MPTSEYASIELGAVDEDEQSAMEVDAATTGTETPEPTRKVISKQSFDYLISRTYKHRASYHRHRLPRQQCATWTNARRSFARL